MAEGVALIQETALDYADDYADKLDEQLEAVQEALEFLKEETDDFISAYRYAPSPFPTYTPNDLQPPPSLPSSALNIEQFSRTIALDTVPNVDDPGAPAAFTKAAPVVTFDDALPSAMPAFTGAQEPVVFVDAPTLDDVTVRSAPEILGIDIPEIPYVDIPTYDDELDFDILPTSDLNAFSFNETRYTSELLNNATSKLMYDLVNGGYGIEVEDEQRLWNRARERELTNLVQAVDEAAKRSAASGFVVPGGAYYAQVGKAQRELTTKMSDLSRDIAVKRADMFVENRKFTIQEVKAFETLLSNIYGAYMERVFNAAKAVSDVSAQIFDSKVKVYNATVDAYKTRMEIFNTNLKAALAPIEVAKTKLEATKISADINRLTLEAYSTEVNAANTLMNMQKAKVDIYATRMQTERTKIDLFKAQVDAYSAQSQAKRAEIDVYKARIDGKIATIDAYSKEVAAYRSNVEAYQARVQVKQLQLDAVIKRNDALVREFEAHTTAYKTRMDTEIARAKFTTDVKKIEADIWSKNRDGDLQARKIEYEDIQHLRELELKKADAAIKSLENKLEASLNITKVTLDHSDKLVVKFSELIRGALMSVAGIEAKITGASEAKK